MWLCFDLYLVLDAHIKDPAGTMPTQLAWNEPTQQTGQLCPHACRVSLYFQFHHRFRWQLKDHISRSLVYSTQIILNLVTFWGICIISILCHYQESGWNRALAFAVIRSQPLIWIFGDRGDMICFFSPMKTIIALSIHHRFKPAHIGPRHMKCWAELWEQCPGGELAHLQQPGHTLHNPAVSSFRDERQQNTQRNKWNSHFLSFPGPSMSQKLGVLDMYS